MGIEKLRQLQIGQEVTPGTAVACTAVWRGQANSIVDPTELVLPNEHVGYLMQVDRGYHAMTEATYESPETEVTFEQCLYPFEAGIKTVSPTGNGGTTNGYIYSYPLLSTDRGFVKVASSENPVKVLTLKGGDDQQAYAMDFSFCEQIAMSGAINDSLKWTHNWRGRQRTKTTFDALSLVAVEEILFNKGKLYLDATGGTIGTTQKTATWLGFNLALETGWRAVFTGDGGMYFTFIKNIGPKLSGTLTLEYDDVAEAMEDAKIAGTTQLMRMLFAGSALTGTGGTYTTKLLRVDSAIKIKSIAALESQDGNDTLVLNWEAVQGNAGQATPTFTAVNTLSAMV